MMICDKSTEVTPHSPIPTERSVNRPTRIGPSVYVRIFEGVHKVQGQGGLEAAGTFDDFLGSIVEKDSIRGSTYLALAC